MHLLDYAYYMYWRQYEVFWLSLILKLGFHLLTTRPHPPSNWNAPGTGATYESPTIMVHFYIFCVGVPIFLGTPRLLV
jgi:hypothetical protein